MSGNRVLLYSKQVVHFRERTYIPLHSLRITQIFVDEAGIPEPRAAGIDLG